MRKILLIGPAPQNIGGVSVHLKRLVHLLSDKYSFDVIDEGHKEYEETFNLRSLNLFTYFNKILKSDIVHIHSGTFILRLFHIIICKLILRKYTIVTVHKDPHREGKVAVTKFFLQKCDKVIMVNQEGYDAVNTQSLCKYYLLPAFLPPIFSQEPNLPSTIEDWILKARSVPKSIILVSNAFNLVLNKGVDLYGLDICIELMRKIKDTGCNNFYLVFVVASNIDNKDLMMSYKKQICNFELNHLLLWEEPLSFVKLIEKSDVVLRTTNSDGDAITVREALYLGKRVIASDVVRRPKGTIIFKNRDIEDLYNKILNVSIENESSILPEKLNYKKIYSEIYN